MDEEKIEKLLTDAKKHIPVDDELKKKLRMSYGKQRRARWNGITKTLFGISAAALVFIFFTLSFTQQKFVNAAELLIANALSFMDIAQGDITAIDHQNGHLYLAIKGEGIFHFTSSGLEKVSEAEVDSISVNSEGTKMIFSNEGNVYVFDLIEQQINPLFEGTKSVQWMMPIWKNNEEFYVTKQTATEKQIVLKSHHSDNEKMIANGTNSTVGVTEEFIVYEDNGNVTKKVISTGETTIVDRGSLPTVSKDGNYISYVKEENGLEDVWIIDSNLKTKKKITSNLTQFDSNMPMYQYGLQVWDSKENHLYVIKKRMNGLNVEDIRLAKIELGTQELTSVETVEQFLRALIVRDDDYAKSFMINPPEFLTVSNPSLKGFNILSTTEIKDLEQVQVEATYADGHLPYTILVKLEFQLKREEDGRYKIESISEVDKTELSSLDMETVQWMEGDTERTLFTLNDMRNQKELPNLPIRFSSIAYNLEDQEMIVGVQEMPLNGEASGLSLWSYDIQQNKFTFLDRIHTIQSNQDIVLQGITLSPNNKYLAVDVFSEADFIPYLYIMDLDEPENSMLLEKSTSSYWKGNVLYYELHNGNQTTLHELDMNQIK